MPVRVSATKQVVQDLVSLATVEDAIMLVTFPPAVEAARKDILTLLNIAGIHIQPRPVVLGL